MCSSTVQAASMEPRRQRHALAVTKSGRGRFRLFESPRRCGWQRQLDADARVAM